MGVVVVAVSVVVESVNGVGTVWFRQRVSSHHRAPELAGRPGTCDCGPEN